MASFLWFSQGSSRYMEDLLFKGNNLLSKKIRLVVRHLQRLLCNSLLLGYLHPAPWRKYSKRPLYRQHPASQPCYHQRATSPPGGNKGYTPSTQTPCHNIPRSPSLTPKSLFDRSFKSHQPASTLPDTLTLFSGHLARFFFPMWQHTRSYRWFLEIISISYSIEFLSNPSHKRTLRQEVNSLVQLGATEPVHPQHKEKGFYSRYFFIPEKKGSCRPILDLRHPNIFKHHSRFRMTTLACLIPSLNQGAWIAALDLKDACFHTDIHPMHRRFLLFTLGLEHYQYRIPLFRLSAAPRVFMKVLSMVTAYLCHQDSLVFLYPDY